MLWRERVKNEVRASLELHGIYNEDIAEDIAESIPSPDERNGYAIVPIEPTPEMIAAMLKGWGDAKKKKREADWPAERDAIIAMWEARQRLIELGWRDAVYCPKDGSEFQIIEAGSTGIFDAFYSGEWPDGHIISHDGGDSYVSKPGGCILFKPKPKE